MKKIILALLVCAMTFLGHSQEAYRLSLDGNQTLANGRTSIGNLLNLPVHQSTIIVGGLNDLDGIGAYLDVYGSKLIIENEEVTLDGAKNIVLRREDGRDFYNLFPTLTAKLTPLTLAERETIFSE